MDWSSCPLVISRPGFISGAPALRDDPRMPADLVVENMEWASPRRTLWTTTNSTPRRTTCSPSISTPSGNVPSVLFDKNIPWGIRRHLAGHTVRTTEDEGWSGLSNGDLLSAAEQAGFEVMLTADQRIRYQQN